MTSNTQYTLPEETEAKLISIIGSIAWPNKSAFNAVMSDLYAKAETLMATMRKAEAIAAAEAVVAGIQAEIAQAGTPTSADDWSAQIALFGRLAAAQKALTEAQQGKTKSSSSGSSASSLPEHMPKTKVWKFLSAPEVWAFGAEAIPLTYREDIRVPDGQMLVVENIGDGPFKVLGHISYGNGKFTPLGDQIYLKRGTSGAAGKRGWLYEPEDFDWARIPVKVAA